MKTKPVFNPFDIHEDSQPIPPIVPERNLIADVLFRAIRDVLNNVVCDDGVKNHRDAKTWMRIHLPIDVYDTITPFTFCWCCQQLDLDPFVLRDLVEEMYEKGETVLP